MPGVGASSPSCNFCPWLLHSARARFNDIKGTYNAHRRPMTKLKPSRGAIGSALVFIFCNCSNPWHGSVLLRKQQGNSTSMRPVVTAPVIRRQGNTKCHCRSLVAPTRRHWRRCSYLQVVDTAVPRSGKAGIRMSAPSRQWAAQTLKRSQAKAVVAWAGPAKRLPGEHTLGIQSPDLKTASQC